MVHVAVAYNVTNRKLTERFVLMTKGEHEACRKVCCAYYSHSPHKLGYRFLTHDATLAVIAYQFPTEENNRSLILKIYPLDSDMRQIAKLILRCTPVTAITDREQNFIIKLPDFEFCLILTHEFELICFVFCF